MGNALANTKITWMTGAYRPLLSFYQNLTTYQNNSLQFSPFREYRQSSYYDIYNRKRNVLTFPTQSGSVPVYSSTTKNWFHTHPLFTRSNDEGPWSCLLPPEVKPLVLEASHQPKLQQLRKPNAASAQAPDVHERAILMKNKIEKEKNQFSLGLHVI